MPATPTYVRLNQITLAAASSTVNFDNIPQNYADLVVVISGGASAGQGAYFYFNADTTAANYARVVMYGDGTSAVSGSAADAKFFDITTGQNLIIGNIMDYSSSDKHKTVLTRSNTSGITEATAGRWANTAPITSLRLQTSTGTFNTSTSFSLYGLVA